MPVALPERARAVVIGCSVAPHPVRRPRGVGRYPLVNPKTVVLASQGAPVVGNAVERGERSRSIDRSTVSP